MFQHEVSKLEYLAVFILSSNNNRDGKSAKSEAQVCSNNRVECGGRGKRLSICHHEDVGNVNRTICIKEKRIPKHMRTYPDDYCGSCTDEESTTTTSRLVFSILVT